MKNTIKLKESELSRIIKKVINENMDEENLYSDINNLISDRYSEMDDAKITEVLKNITSNFRAKAHRKRSGIGDITYDEVRKNWQR
jgi:hypothetical protein